MAISNIETSFTDIWRHRLDITIMDNDKFLRTKVMIKDTKSGGIIITDIETLRKIMDFVEDHS